MNAVPPVEQGEAPWPPREPAGITGAAVTFEDVRLLLESLLELTGLDFRGYAYSSIRRRIARAILETDTGTIAGLHQRIKESPETLQRLKTLLTVHTTSLFRDPLFFKELRTAVVPILRTYPFVRIWVAGCSTGEEVYSLAILLHEEDLVARCRIYATDLSEDALDRAKAGVYPLAAMQDYSRNYQMAGGKGSLSDYYTADTSSAIFRRSLREGVVFGTHNLASDASFNEFHLILCRNVLIYFQRELQHRVHSLFYDSLIGFGFLALGKSETMRFSPQEFAYATVNKTLRLYRKVQ